MTRQLTERQQKVYDLGKQLMDAVMEKYHDKFYELADAKKDWENKILSIDEEYCTIDDYTAEEHILFYMGYYNSPIDFITGWRYGDIPESGKSYNYRDRYWEMGVSLAFDDDDEETKDKVSLLFIRQGRELVHISGLWIPFKGSDGEPLVIFAEKIK
jgi:hypothetical protein